MSAPSSTPAKASRKVAEATSASAAASSRAAARTRHAISADDFVGGEEIGDLDRRILVRIGTVDRIGFDRFGDFLADRARRRLGRVGSAPQDRTSVVQGKRGSVSVDLGGRRHIKKHKYVSF